MTSDAIIVASKWTLNSNISYLSYKALITYVPGVYCLYMALWQGHFLPNNLTCKFELYTLTNIKPKCPFGCL